MYCNNLNNYIMRNNHSALYATVLFLLLATLSCKMESKQKDDSDIAQESADKEGFHVLTTSMEFQCVDSIPSGWNKFIYENQSTEPHFILLDKYPEGKSLVDTKKDIVPPFDEGMALIMEGKNEEAMEAFGKLPEWFSEIVFSGGTGLVSPRETAVSHVSLEPGYYIMECYVKMPNGKFHTSMGMTKELYVVDKEEVNEEPSADVEITLSSESGILYTGNLSAGKKVFSVKYLDQIVHENFVGHDLSLVWLDEGADLAALGDWMNWATPTGLMSSTLPEGITFLGGTNDAPAGSVHYFEAELKPGNYAFISEVPNPASKGMLKTFSITE